MEISALEALLLQVISNSPADCGAYVSVGKIARSLPDRDAEEIARALGEAEARQLVERDGHGCAALTESGAAVLKAV